MQGGQGPAQPQRQISKAQLQAGLHHFDAFRKAMTPILNSPQTGQANIRPKIFDASADLIGEKIFTVPEVMNGIKDLPDDPLDQKKWLQQKIMASVLAEKKLVHDYIAQGPQQQPDDSQWSPDSHGEHMGGLLDSYKGK
jgi:hypothetical protein